MTFAGHTFESGQLELCRLDVEVHHGRAYRMPHSSIPMDHSRRLERASLHIELRAALRV